MRVSVDVPANQIDKKLVEENARLQKRVSALQRKADRLQELLDADEDLHKKLSDAKKLIEALVTELNDKFSFIEILRPYEH